MYTIYFDSGKPLCKDQDKVDSKQIESGIGGIFNRVTKINRVHYFEPHGFDVQATRVLLGIQFFDVAIKIVDLFHQVKRGQVNIPGDIQDTIQVLQGLFSVPFLLVSICLYFRFMHAFSRSTQKNIINVTYMMLSENILNFILRFFVGLKSMLKNFDEKSEIKSVIYMIIPIFFGICWALICCKARKKNGEYGAPPGMMYQQNQKEASNLKKDNLWNSYSDESTRDQEQSYHLLTPNNLHLLGEDLEDQVGSQNADQCILFDKDLETMPLFQPRDTYEPRQSCPNDPRAALGLLQSQKNNNQDFEFDKESITKQSTFSISSNTSSTLSLNLMGKNQGQRVLSFQQFSQQNRGVVINNFNNKSVKKMCVEQKLAETKQKFSKWNRDVCEKSLDSPIIENSLEVDSQNEDSSSRKTESVDFDQIIYQ